MSDPGGEKSRVLIEVIEKHYSENFFVRIEGYSDDTVRLIVPGTALTLSYMDLSRVSRLLEYWDKRDG